MRALLPIILCLAAGPAAAHGGHPVAPGQLLADWQVDPLLAVLLALFAIAYLRGLSALWRRAGLGRGVRLAEATSYAAGLAVLAVALLSPLEAATGTLLSAHMVQHVLLIAVAPPLLLLGRPDAVLAFALPASSRQSLSRALWPRRVTGFFRRLARPMPAALLHAAAIWIWHAPGPFQAALTNPFLHDLEHASFFVTALLFWQSVLVALRSPSNLIAAILATLATLIHGGFLGALITLTGRPLYPAYAETELWGLTAIEDQQLAGLIMWVPASAVYLAAGLALAAKLIGFDEPARQRIETEPVRPAAE
jgi:putative membrane protein